MQIYYKYEKMEELRKQQGLTQTQVAEVLGMTQQQYQLYESGKREILLHLMIKLADFYDVSMDYIVGRKADDMAAR